MTSRRSRLLGLTLLEVVFALFLITVTALSLVAVLAAGLRTETKDEHRDAQAAATTFLLQSLLRDVKDDNPPGLRSQFWGSETPTLENPFRSGTEKIGSAEYSYHICLSTVLSSEGSVFGAPDHRLKQIDIFVHWSGDFQRSGYGSTLYHDKILFSEVSGEAL